MIALRDVLIFAGLVAIAAAFIASLFPVRQSFTPPPACSDCAFMLNGPYSIVQYGNYAALQLGQRQIVKYGWAYVDGKPLSPGQQVSCSPMYLWVISGIAYTSCTGRAPAIGLNYTASYTPPSFTAPITVVVNDQPNAQWTITWSGGASGSRSGSTSGQWTIYANGPVSFSAQTTGNCYITPSSTTANLGQTVTFMVVCPRYLELDITYYMGYPYGCRNNVHVAWGSTTANFCSSSNPGYATLWIDLTTGQWTTQKPSTITTCSPITPTVQKYWQIYGGGYLSYLNLWTSGNKVSFRGDGFDASYGFTATAQGLRLTVYVNDWWMADWNQGADVYFYFCT